ncbi:acyl-CoA N-acyltransferase [Nemania serpens]|nr:acyl-CoA N-acyltransferase [Nemania serpens]
MSTPPSKHREKGEEVDVDDNSDNNDNTPPAITDDAIDDTEDLADDVANVRKTLSCERRRRQSRQTHGIQDLFPFPFSPLIRPLTISDLESCVALENAAFANPAHRSTREKFIYRLTECPELCMGVFCTVVPSKTKGWEIDTLHTAHPVETGRDDGAVSVLLAHIVATRSHDDVVTDEAMDYPDAYKTAKSNKSDNDGDDDDRPSVGHQDTGRTVCIHSLAVHPKLQGVGMGKLIVKAYLQQIKSSEIADRVALICQEYLVNYYKRHGFTHVGPSKANFSGGGWHDMAFDLRGPAI